MNTLKVLVSAYACRPGKGSEPGVGWNMVRELAREHKVWVLTRENNRPSLEAELGQRPITDLQFIYCDLPKQAQQLNQGQRLVHIHYYLWQITAYFVARALHRELDFDLIHHVTYVRYWSPSFLALLPVPFIWGPVGGGESAPKPFWRDFGVRGRLYERLRNLACGLGEIDPFVRLTALRSTIAHATTEDTAQRLRKLGAKNVQVFSQLGLSQDEITQLAQHVLPFKSQVRFISIGRLLHWKGFHLGLRAFARANLAKDAEYWIVGDGPERARLQTLAQELGLSDQVKFWGELPREETLHKLGECLALVHPSLHESGGLVCLEAMATGCPVICLDLGGPAIQVTEETGFKIAAHTPDQSVLAIAKAMARLAQDPELQLQMSQASQKRAGNVYNWAIKGQVFSQLYAEVVAQQPRKVVEPQVSLGNQ